MKTRFKLPIIIYLIATIISLIGVTLFTTQTAILFSRVLMVTGLVLLAIAIILTFKTLVAGKA